MKKTALNKTCGITAGALSLTLLFAHGVSKDELTSLCERYQPAPDLQSCISKSSGGKMLEEHRRSFAQAILNGLGAKKVKACICITEGGRFCWIFDPATGEFKGKVTDDLDMLDEQVAFIFADTPASKTASAMASNKKVGVSRQQPVGVVKKLTATKSTKTTTTKIPNPRNRTSRHEGTGRQIA